MMALGEKKKDQDSAQHKNQSNQFIISTHQTQFSKQLQVLIHVEKTMSKLENKL